MAAETNRWVCAGTKRISFAEIDSSPSDGLISVYIQPPSDAALDVNDGAGSGSGRRSPACRLDRVDSSGRLHLHVLITDGARTFYETIASKDVKHMASEDGPVLDRVASILLSPSDATFKVSYKRVGGQLLGGRDDSKNTTSIKASVRKTLVNGIVRPVWEGQLDDVRHFRRDGLPRFVRSALPEEDVGRPEPSSGLAFSVALGDAANGLRDEIASLRAENARIRASASRWKSTSERLSGRWEKEKGELTERFLTLFNEHKARHVEALKELDRLRGKRRRGDELDGKASRRDEGVRKEGEGALELPDDEDEHDYAVYDAETVERLAAGRRGKDRKPAAGRRGRGRREGGMAGHVNPHTGAMEFSKPEEIFSSDDD